MYRLSWCLRSVELQIADSPLLQLQEQSFSERFRPVQQSVPVLPVFLRVRENPDNR